MSITSFKDQYHQGIELLFLKEVFFEKTANISASIAHGILCIVDGLSDYHEEGKLLMPEIIVVSNLQLLKKQFKHFHTIKIGDFALPTPTPAEYERILKSCAPLAIGGWVIYIEVNQFLSPPSVEFGIINGVKDELTEPIIEQIFSSPDDIDTTLKCIYIRNIGQKNVRLKGLRNDDITLSFSTNSTQNIPLDNVERLVTEITKSIKSKRKKETRSFLIKEIYHAINQGHGTLIGVASKKIAFEGDGFLGYKLDQPINIAELVAKALESRKPEDYSMLRQFAFVIEAAINNDGITIFSADGQFLGFHFIIHKKKYQKGAGGARSQAFEAMIDSEMFSCCFYKSQDGKTKVWTDEESETK